MKKYNQTVAFSTGLSSLLLMCLLLLLSGRTWAQIGEHRNVFSVGVNGGYVMSNVGYVPSVSQGMHGGMTGGLSFRYTSEKYFSTICSIYAEFNYAQAGWKEDIRDMQDQPVINSVMGVAEEYERTLSYVQLPVFAHLAWGREQKGFNFFIMAGPQFGYLLGESTTKNFDFAHVNLADRANKTFAQDTTSVEHKFDYGIAAGGGIEYSHPKIGHIRLEGRYYYGLGNIFGDSKRDNFSKSNLGNIVVKVAYLRDI